MKPRIASAPCSFGVFETNIEDGVHPTPAQLVKLMHEGGYAGTELGPPGFLGSGEAVAALLAQAGLELAGSFLMFRFSREPGFDEDLNAMESALAQLRIAAGDNEPPVVLLSDAFGAEPDRMSFAGAIDQHPEAWLSADRQRLLLANVHRAAERCSEMGFRCSLHHHAGTYIETRREIAAVVEAMDTDLLGLCFDTGHVAFGGSEPLDVLRDYVGLVNHVHLKDVDRGLLRAVHADGGGLDAAWDTGVFCGLGDGDAQVETCVDELGRNGYAGWLVVEQDRPLSPDWTLADAARAQRANRKWLAARGL